jgi:hypothetical protein
MLTYRAGGGATFAVVIAVPVDLAPPGMAQTAPRVTASPVAALTSTQSLNRDRGALPGQGHRPGHHVDR